MVYIGLYVREHLNRLLNPETMLFFQHVFTIMGKSSVNGPLSIAMLNNQRVYIYIYLIKITGQQPPQPPCFHFAVAPESSAPKACW